jgi:cation transport regulator
MPYKRLSDLPDGVQDNLPEHAQEIYKEAYNSAWEQYADPKERRDDASREEVAHRVAWAAVKQSYTKDAEGHWVKQKD